MTSYPVLAARLAAATVFLLAGCSPKYDWREVHGSGIPFTVVLPAKPATQVRTINLDGTQVAMTMTAAEAGGATFAVGAAELPDAAQAQRALGSMKTALVRNINGTVRKESTASSGGQTQADLEAAGPQHVLFARFIARDKRIYQILAVGQSNSLQPETVDTFMTSFKPE